MAFRHLGNSAQQALPGEVLLVVRKLALASSRYLPRGIVAGRAHSSQGFKVVSLGN